VLLSRDAKSNSSGERRESVRQTDRTNGVVSEWGIQYRNITGNRADRNGRGEARVLVGRTGTIGSGKQLEQHREKRWVKLVLR